MLRDASSRWHVKDGSFAPLNRHRYWNTGISVDTYGHPGGRLAFPCGFAVRHRLAIFDVPLSARFEMKGKVERERERERWYRLRENRNIAHVDSRDLFRASPRIAIELWASSGTQKDDSKGGSGWNSTRDSLRNR